MARNRSEKEATPEVDDKGTKRWRRNGKLHREDGAAVEYANGNQCWFRDGKPHRRHGPAVEFRGGHKEYWLDGVRQPVGT